MLKFIGEIGSNHNRDVCRTLELIKKAKEIGCWAVKFQLFKASRLYAAEFKDKISEMSKWELPKDFLSHIKLECQKHNLKFICSVFDVDSIKILKSVEVDILKLSSYEMLYYPLISAVIDSKLPWIYSAGMTETIIDVFRPVIIGVSKDNPPYAILHCCSNYPSLPHHCNLSRIKEIEILQETLNCHAKIGWSDHTRNKDVVLAAIREGAKIIEFHLDLDDKKGAEYKLGHCWPVSRARKLIAAANCLESTGDNFQGKNKWIFSFPDECEAKKWRMDPEDGFRPLRKHRKELIGD